MQITVSNRRWNLRFVRTKAYDGECDPPTTVGKEIRVADNLKGERKLDVLIHEMLHAAGWHIDEEFIAEFATDAARALTKLGYTDNT
jgi:hypothetical protein